AAPTTSQAHQARGGRTTSATVTFATTAATALVMKNGCAVAAKARGSHRSSTEYTASGGPPIPAATLPNPLATPVTSSGHRARSGNGRRAPRSRLVTRASVIATTTTRPTTISRVAGLASRMRNAAGTLVLTDAATSHAYRLQSTPESMRQSTTNAMTAPTALTNRTPSRAPRS